MMASNNHHPFVLTFILHLTLLIRPSSAVSFGKLKVVPIVYQSQGLNFSDWISILTLCFAPLLVHLVAGTPNAICLGPRRHLSWHRSICQYNPTTILWRYFAIADRRVRARSWNANDLAASNALFWTSKGWDGSEAMVERSRKHLIVKPASAHTQLLSQTTIKTLIVTLQGVQAALVLVAGLIGTEAFSSFQTDLSIESIFFPLAILGLLRLVAAPWLTDKFVYLETEELETEEGNVISDEDIIRDARMKPQTMDQDIELTQPHPTIQRKPVGTATSTERLLKASSHRSQHSRTRFYPTTNWRGILFRILFLIPILALLALCVFYIVPWIPDDGITDFVSTIPATGLMINIVYLVWISVSLVTFVYYFFWGHAATTVIPCIVDTWYQVYTSILFVLTLALFLIAAVSTRKTPCGTFTSWPKEVNVCRGIEVRPTQVNADPFGLAVKFPGVTATRDEYKIVEFDGWCIGEGLGSGAGLGASHLTVTKNSTSS